jgi:beta-glucosidase/6-phospho-beta-glucosidase/beta-galactosidase
LKTGESVVDLYEVDEKGFTTGYLIRKLNYGLFYKNYDNELKRINKVVGDVIGKIIEPDARVAPDDETILSKDKLRKLGIDYLSGDVSVRQAWNELRNKWLYDNCERKYNKKYYDAWNKVPQIAKDALDSINSEISSILSQPDIIDENGHPRYDKLSDEDWDTL